MTHGALNFQNRVRVNQITLLSNCGEEVVCDSLAFSLAV